MNRPGKQKIKFTLYGEDAELARQFQAATGVPLADVASFAVMNYMVRTLEMAERMGDGNQGIQDSPDGFISSGLGSEETGTPGEREDEEGTASGG